MIATSSTEHIESVHAETGMFWAGDEGADLLRVVEFAGNFVPDSGLVLNPPFGGELTVWPDGQYSFVCPVSGDGGQSMVATHYSYIVEAMDGSTSFGTFALGEQAPEETMPDFQSWSLDDILALEDVVGLSVNAHGPVAEFMGVDAGVDLDLSGDAGGFSVDVLEQMIKTSCES
jgi:hypothetical protein